MFPNMNQMKKLQKEVAKDVDVVMKKRDEELKKKIKEERALRAINFVGMRDTFSKLKEKYPGRGEPMCLWNGAYYSVGPDGFVKFVDITNGGAFSEEQVLASFERFGAEEVGTYDKVYYLMKKEIFDRTKKIMDFVKENYVVIRAAQVSYSRFTNRVDEGGSSESGNGLEKVSDLMVIGQKFQELEKIVPGVSMNAFVEAINIVGRQIVDALVRC